VGSFAHPFSNNFLIIHIGFQMRILQVFLIAFLFLNLQFVANAQPKSQISHSGNLIPFLSGEYKCRIEVRSSSIIRIRQAAPDGFDADENLMVASCLWLTAIFRFRETMQVFPAILNI
jgi:hypothetical protein